MHQICCYCKHVFKSVNTLHAWFLHSFFEGQKSILKTSSIPVIFELLDISNKWKSIFSGKRKQVRGRWPLPILHPCRISHSLASTLDFSHFLQCSHSISHAFYICGQFYTHPLLSHLFDLNSMLIAMVFTFHEIILFYFELTRHWLIDWLIAAWIIIFVALDCNWKWIICFYWRKK